MYKNPCPSDDSQQSKITAGMSLLSDYFISEAQDEHSVGEEHREQDAHYRHERRGPRMLKMLYEVLSQ